MELFAHGTIKDYYQLKEKGEVWTLSDSQLEKLRMLSVVSFIREQRETNHSSGVQSGGGSSSTPSGACVGGGTDVEMMAGLALKKSPPKKDKRNKQDRVLSVSYSRLASELLIPENGEPYNEQTQEHMRSLENLLIQCIYSNVINAKLDQSSKCVLLLTHELGRSNKEGMHGSVLMRDLKTSTPESTNAEITRMVSCLQQFLKQSNSLLLKLEHSSKAASSIRHVDELRWKEVQRLLDDTSSQLREESASSGRGGGEIGITLTGEQGGGDPMEVVDLVGRRQVKRSKGGHSMVLGGGGGVRFS